MPPWASTYLKYAWAPQLSVSPICAYGPASARSPQATIGELLLAELPPPELHAAMPPTMRTAAAAAVRAANGIRLRDMYCQPPYFWLEPHEERVHDGRGPEVRGTAVKDEPAAGEHEDPLADLRDQIQVVLDEQHAGAFAERGQLLSEAVALLF